MADVRWQARRTSLASAPDVARQTQQRPARFGVTRMRLHVGLAVWRETVCLSIELQLNY